MLNIVIKPARQPYISTAMVIDMMDDIIRYQNEQETRSWLHTGWDFFPCGWGSWDGWMAGWLNNGWMTGWLDGWMNGVDDEGLNCGEGIMDELILKSQFSRVGLS